MSEEKIIDTLSRIITELGARNGCYNCVYPGLLSYGWNDLCNTGSELFQQLKEESKAADVVEVVYCKDCKWFDPDENIVSNSGRCGYHETVKMFLDFCSCGKKSVVD